MKKIKVIKIPLPNDYLVYLEADKKPTQLSASELQAIKDKYKDQDIHALTGATISSVAVSDGIKNVMKKFAYRIQILDNILKQENILAAF